MTSAIPDNVRDTAKLLVSNSARYDYTGIGEPEHHALIPIPQIFNMVGDAMVGYAKRIARSNSMRGSHDPLSPLVAKEGRIGQQLKQISGALIKMAEGQAPDAGELRALKGDAKLKLLPADDALVEAYAWFKVATSEDHDNARPSPDDQRPLEKQLYKIFDHYVPVNDHAAIPEILLNSSSILSRLTNALPDISRNR